jgi:uncharacterized alpha-E superfamily protein
MLSRTAEALFWIGRYLERAEHLARVVDIAYHSRVERPGGRRRGAAYWEPLLAISGERDRFFESHTAPGARSVSRFLTFEADNPNSILICLRRARENANSMRDRISSEMWETLNSFYLWLSERSLLHEITEGNVHALYSDVKEQCHLFEGVTQGTMTRDEGWLFLRAGKYLERAATTARVLDVQYPLLLADETAGTPDVVHQWMWLLRSLSAYEAYCKAFHFGIHPEQVAEFLICNRGFPRSVRFAVASTESSLKRISGSPPGRHADEAERVLGSLQASLVFREPSEIRDGHLHGLLEDVQRRCVEVSNHLVDVYFAYKVPGAHEA